jgi:hypothetical protein
MSFVVVPLLLLVWNQRFVSAGSGIIFVDIVLISSSYEVMPVLCEPYKEHY